MNPGFGPKGPRRCYPMWRDYSLCMNASPHPTECEPFKEDYLSCILSPPHGANASCDYFPESREDLVRRRQKEFQERVESRVKKGTVIFGTVEDAARLAEEGYAMKKVPWSEVKAELNLGD